MGHAKHGEEGFTLIELAMVVVILAVLLAVAIPYFLGARQGAQDRAAHTDLRNVLLAEKMIWLESGGYTGDFGAVSAVRAGSPLDNDPTLGVFVDVNDVDDRVVCLIRASASGRVFSIWENAVAGTFYGTTDLSVADCPGAVPAGYHQGGF